MILYKKSNESSRRKNVQIKKSYKGELNVYIKKQFLISFRILFSFRT